MANVFTPDNTKPTPPGLGNTGEDGGNGSSPLTIQGQCSLNSSCGTNQGLGCTAGGGATGAGGTAGVARVAAAVVVASEAAGALAVGRPGMGC